jgi:hypothetical protein
MTTAPGPFARWIRYGVLLIAAALVLVPSAVRARQTLAFSETIPTSIRLNWNGDGPPIKAVRLLPDAPHTIALASSGLREQPDERLVEPRPCAFETTAPTPPLDNAPDVLRGPPVFSFA